MKKKFALIGSPVAHSRSPIMHAAAFAAMGLPHTYEALLVPAENVATRVDELRAGLWNGLNVTLPHKRAVLSLVDKVDPIARAVGAANTLVREPGTQKLLAFNTDVQALGEELLDLTGTPNKTLDSAIILGSGGAARCAIAACVLYMGSTRVFVRSRSFSDRAKADDFARELTAAMATLGKHIRVHADGLSSSAHAATRAESNCACVVQATSAGMLGADSGEEIARAVHWDSLPPSCVALDVVYNPPETPFLLAAGHAGIRSKCGIGMLARQGALALDHWLGTPPPFNALLAALAL
jgi:shikimate dehydrogenase